MKENSSKENISKDKNIGELLKEWEKSEEEKKKDYDTFLRGIKHSQRLKHQNSYILEQN